MYLPMSVRIALLILEATMRFSSAQEATLNIIGNLTNAESQNAQRIHLDMHMCVYSRMHLCIYEHMYICMDEDQTASEEIGSKQYLISLS